MDTFGSYNARGTPLPPRNYYDEASTIYKNVVNVVSDVASDVYSDLKQHASNIRHIVPHKTKDLGGGIYVDENGITRHRLGYHRNRTPPVTTPVEPPAQHMERVPRADIDATIKRQEAIRNETRKKGHHVNVVRPPPDILPANTTPPVNPPHRANVVMPVLPTPPTLPPQRLPPPTPPPVVRPVATRIIDDNNIVVPYVDESKALTIYKKTEEPHIDDVKAQVMSKLPGNVDMAMVDYMIAHKQQTNYNKTYNNREFANRANMNARLMMSH